MEYHPPLHLSAVAIEKGAIGSPSTKVANFTYFYYAYKTCNFFRIGYVLKYFLYIAKFLFVLMISYVMTLHILNTYIAIHLSG